MTLRVGLTGGIGCGKSVVASYFATFGVEIIDADIIARELLVLDTSAYKAVVQHFGNSVLTASGEINRGILRNIVFSSQKERCWLESLLHPLIYTELYGRFKQVRGPYCIVVVPLLVEVNGLVARVLVVDCPQAMQIERIVARDGCSKEVAQAIIAVQASREQRLALADDVICNDKDLEFLRNQVAQLHEQYLAWV